MSHRARVVSPRLLFAASLCWLCVLSTLCWLNGPGPVQVPSELARAALRDAAADPRYAELYRRPDRLPSSTRFLLLWTPAEFAPLSFLGRGQRAFLEAGCARVDCYVTDDRELFGGDLSRFHAVAFNGRNLEELAADPPPPRAPHHTYIYFNMESAPNYPACSPDLDRFFDWTATYRLDSEIPLPYVRVQDRAGRQVAPSSGPAWLPPPPPAPRDAALSANKSEAAAWIVSNCGGAVRGTFVRRLRRALGRLSPPRRLYVYGACGRRCGAECPTLLRHFYFYLALENSSDRDYVTEKVLHALRQGAIPVVLGGADYSRFLPPRSYLDGSAGPDRTAREMARLMSSPQQYGAYFWWRAHYNYSDPKLQHNVCRVCDALHEPPPSARYTRYNNFREWWLPGYEAACVNTTT